MEAVAGESVDDCGRGECRRSVGPGVVGVRCACALCSAHYPRRRSKCELQSHSGIMQAQVQFRK